MTINKYEKTQRSLYEAFTKFLVGFAKKAKTKEEEKIMISMAKEVWNISYFNKKAQEEEIEEFINSLKIEESKLSVYRNMMIQGIRDKKKAIDVQIINYKNILSKSSILKGLRQ